MQDSYIILYGGFYIIISLLTLQPYDRFFEWKFRKEDALLYAN